MKKAKRFLAMTLCLAMALALVACGGGSSSTPSTSGNSSTPSVGADTSYVPPEEGAKYEETVYSAYQADLMSPAPYDSGEAVVSFFTNMTFRTATFNNPDTGELEGILAEKWEDVNGDGKTWDITLKPGVKFHDGSELTAEDLKFTWEYAGIGTGNTTKTISTYASVDSIEVVDKLVCRFNLKAAMFDFPTYLDQKMLSKSAYDKLGADKFGSIGCGPYYFDETLTQSGVQFGATRFEDYFEGTDNYPTKHIVFKVIPDASTMVASLQAGEIDFILNVSTANALLLQGDSNIQVWERSGANSYFMGFNYRKDTWKNPELRKALAMAIDKQAIIDGNFDGFGAAISDNFCAPTGAGYTEVPVYKYDPEAAQALLKANNAEGMTIKILSNPTQKTNCEIIQAYLGQVGITAEIIPVESTSWAENLKNGDYDIFCNYCAYQGALLYNFQRFFYTGGSSNTFTHDNAEWNALYDAAANATSYDEMVAKFQDLQKYHAENQVIVPLAIAKFLAASQKDVQGIQLAPTTNWNDFSTVYIPARG